MRRCGHNNCFCHWRFIRFAGFYGGTHATSRFASVVSVWCAVCCFSDGGCVYPGPPTRRAGPAGLTAGVDDDRRQLSGWPDALRCRCVSDLSGREVCQSAGLSARGRWPSLRRQAGLCGVQAQPWQRLPGRQHSSVQQRWQRRRCLRAVRRWSVPGRSLQHLLQRHGRRFGLCRRYLGSSVQLQSARP